MDREQTIKLFKAGKNAWNKWAIELLAKKEEFKKSGTWEEKSRANFMLLCFTQNEVNDVNGTERARIGTFTSFAGFIFPGTTTFSGCTFCSIVNFGNAVFKDEVYFFDARFLESVDFGKSQFDKLVSFSTATFKGLFNSFNKAVFSNGVIFNTISVERSFILSEARFHFLPCFVEAHFSEAPRLDDFILEPTAFTIAKTSSIQRKKSYIATWRALRRLATQGHDHESELKFLAGEIKARRAVYDRPFSPAYIFGLLYEYLSDFGRSIGLPLLWLVGSTLFFAVMYFLIDAKIYSCSFSLWGCLGVYELKAISALETSINGLAKIASFESVLSWTNLIQSIQKIFNASLLFLFGLALRNRFKVK